MAAFAKSSDRLFNVCSFFYFKIRSFSSRHSSHDFLPAESAGTRLTTDHLMSNCMPCSLSSQVYFESSVSVAVVVDRFLVIVESFFQRPSCNTNIVLSLVCDVVIAACGALWCGVLVVTAALYTMLSVRHLLPK